MITTKDSATVPGALWGARARDWAEIQEVQSRPLFDAALDAAGVRRQVSLLDAGCGSGTCCHMAAQRGADAVCGFESFQYAANPLQALREAARVAKRGGTVIIATWGKAGDCEAFALSEDGVLEALARDASFEPKGTHAVECVWSYPDLDTVLRGLLSSGPAVKAIQTSGEPRVRDAVAEAIRPFRTASGGYCMENRFRYLVARA